MEITVPITVVQRWLSLSPHSPRRVSAHIKWNYCRTAVVRCWLFHSSMIPALTILLWSPDTVPIIKIPKLSANIAGQLYFSVGRLFNVLQKGIQN